MRALFSICLFVVAGLTTAVHAQSFQIQEFKSPDGHEIWLVEDHSNPIVTLELAFKSGSYRDPEGLEGVGQMLGWLFNEGAGELPADEFQSIMSDESFSIAAQGSFERTTVSLQYLTENQDLVFEMLALALNSPRFDADAVDRARDHYAREVLRRINGPGEDFGRDYGPLNYGEDHPFLRYSNGTMDSLAAITTEDLAAAHQRTYVTQGLEVNAVGDITPQALGELLDQALSALPQGQTVNERPAPTGPIVKNLVVTDYAQPVTIVVGTAPGISFNDDDLRAARVADQILGGSGLSSRLFASVREEAGLVYGISSSLNASRDFGRIGFSFQTANESVDEALDMTLQVYRDFAENGPTQEEVDRAKALITGSFPLRFQTSRDIAGYMNTLRVLNLPPEFPSYRNAEFETVTLEQVKAVAKRLYGNPEFLLGMIGRPEGRTPGVYNLD